MLDMSVISCPGLHEKLDLTSLSNIDYKPIKQLEYIPISRDSLDIIINCGNNCIFFHHCFPVVDASAQRQAGSSGAGTWGGHLETGSESENYTKSTRNLRGLQRYPRPYLEGTPR